MKTDVTVTTALSTGKPHSMYVLRHEFWVLGVRAGGILFGVFFVFFCHILSAVGARVERDVTYCHRHRVWCCRGNVDTGIRNRSPPEIADSPDWKIVGFDLLSVFTHPVRSAGWKPAASQWTASAPVTESSGINGKECVL